MNDDRAWTAAGWGLLAMAVLLRVWNGVHYPTRLGFDSVENVEYVTMLMRSWSLPAPDAAWATSHPPLYYYVSAGIGRALLALGERDWILPGLQLFSGGVGLGIAGLAAATSLHLHPGDVRRAALAFGLLAFLPVHVYLGAMINEETLAAFLVSAPLALTLRFGFRRNEDHELDVSAPGPGAATLVGITAGLALLTKLSGLLVIGSIGLAWLIAGGAAERPSPFLKAAICFGTAALVVGGWFYLRNLALYGYLYPQDLSVHALMFDMPPGERSIRDYVYVPLATFWDPQLLNPALLRSIWGSTYATLFFDGHRHFLPQSQEVTALGRALLVLGLFPMLALCSGLWRGVRRAISRPQGPDTLMLLLIASTLAGYVAFTSGNPWFATVKAGYLLGLSIPFAYYASDGMVRFMDRSPGRAGLAVSLLAALLGGVLLTFSFGLVFEKTDGPGLPWKAAAGVEEPSLR